MSRSRRRQFLLASGALLAAHLAYAQKRDPDRVRTIGFLFLHADDPKYPPSEYHTEITLRKLGWIEGKNLVIERRFADFKVERLADLAQDLIRKRVELIVTAEDSPALAAARATRTIPIVFINMSFPVERGLVDSLARPGRNITGTTWQHGFDDARLKRLDFLREVAPTAKRVYALVAWVAGEALDGKQLTAEKGLEERARRLGFEIRLHTIRKTEDVDSALAAALAWNAQAIVGAGAHVEAARERVAEFALRHRLPSAFLRASNVEAGGLLSYGMTTAEFFQLIESGMEYVDRILRGANPAELPVVQPRTHELLINLRTAKAIGLTIPQSLLVRADRVIE